MQHWDELLSYMPYAKAYVFNLWANTDDRGDAEYNMKLADRRAQSVIGYLMDKGVPIKASRASVMEKAIPSLKIRTNKDGAKTEGSTSNWFIQPTEVFRLCLKKKVVQKTQQ